MLTVSSDSDLNTQQSSNSMVNALRRQMKWMVFGSEGNPFQQYHPIKPFMHAYNKWQMNKYISPEVDARFAIQQEYTKSKDANAGHAPAGKSVIDLALTAYLKENGNAKVNQGIDHSFKEIAMDQMKLLLFAGHETTSSSTCYVLYLLSTHPEVLSRVRAEHDQVFGPAAAEVATKLTENAYLLNQLPYTVAVIKETLRLFPTASTTRSGVPGLSITDAGGRLYPTEGCFLWLISHAIQRDPAYWPQPDDFIPDRWLVAPGDPLYPIKGAWRPFEHGPRSCIGMELSMIEIKIAVALVARTFDIRAVYEEFDCGLKNKDTIKTVVGNRAYQSGVGQPSENLPCRIYPA